MAYVPPQMLPAQEHDRQPPLQQQHRYVHGEHPPQQFYPRQQQAHVPQPYQPYQQYQQLRYQQYQQLRYQQYQQLRYQQYQHPQPYRQCQHLQPYQQYPHYYQHQHQQHYQPPGPWQPNHDQSPPPRSQVQQQQWPNEHQQRHPQRQYAPQQPLQQRHHTGRGHNKSIQQNNHGRKGIKIPENWADVPKMGDVVRDSRFVPMRCPLDAKYTHLYASPDDAWSPEVFVQEQARRGYNVGMVIDLTNTYKYYDGSVAFGDSGIEYVKLKIEGFNAPPREQDVEQFTAIVDAFLAKADPSATIAVHCTHGLNRTGYLIAHYLVTKQRCSVTHALASFSLARPPGLIKHIYVEALYRLLGETEEVVLPVLPAWAAEKYGKRR